MTANSIIRSGSRWRSQLHEVIFEADTPAGWESTPVVEKIEKDPL